MTFERLKRREIYRSRWVNLYVDRVRFPNGHLLEELHLVDFEAASVVIIVEDQMEKIALVRVPRYATGQAEWELPAGWVDPEDADYLGAVRRLRIGSKPSKGFDHPTILEILSGLRRRYETGRQNLWLFRA